MKKFNSLVGVTLTVVLFAGVFLTCPCASAKKDTASRDRYSDWMGENKEIIKNLPINRVPLLGSHDAGSCDVDSDSPPCTGYLTHSGHHIHRMPRGSDVSSARCQSASIRDQLLYGVRYFDLRIARQNGVYCIEHMWLSTPLLGDGGVFNQIKGFLREHPQEIVILHMQELYSDTGRMDSAERSAYFQLVKQEFGSALAARGDFASTTFGSIWSQGANIILVADVESSSEPFIWYERQIDTRWMNKKNPEDLADALDANVIAGWRRGDYADKLRVLQAMTTTKHKIRNAKKTNAVIKKRLETDWEDAPINVVQVDDSVKSGLMPVLIKRLETTK